VTSRRSIAPLLLAIVATATAACVGMAACGGDARSDEAAGWVASMREASESADRALAQRDLGRAEHALRDALGRDVPSAVAPEDRRIVRADLHYRFAELELGRGDPIRAEELATRALDEGRGRDVFTANLLIVRGGAREARGDDAGAAEDYYEALRISEELMQSALGGEE
jgi:hypothetical protein